MIERIKLALEMGPCRFYSRKTVRDRMRCRWYGVQDFISGRWNRYSGEVLRLRAKAQGAGFMCGRRGEVPGGVSSGFPGPDYWRLDGTCNYCGSLSPAQLFKAIADGCEIGPTDKDYKIYIEGTKAPRVGGACKFYFQHLSVEEKKVFVGLMNDRKLKFSYPGHFYVRPYFVSYLKAV